MITSNFRKRSQIISNNSNLGSKNKAAQKTEKDLVLAKLINTHKNEAKNTIKPGSVQLFLLKASDRRDFENRKAAVLVARKMVQEGVNNAGETNYFNHGDRDADIRDISKYNGSEANLKTIKEYVLKLLGTKDQPTEIKHTLEDLAVPSNALFNEIKCSLYRTNYTKHMINFTNLILMQQYQTYVSPTGSSYTGAWSEAGFQGEVSCTYSHGAKYKGNFKDNQRDGQGIYTFRDGAIYTGNWHNNHREGHGIETYPNGDRYDGNWHDDKKNGSGSYSSLTGNTYNGEWKNNQKDGTGIYSASDRRSYNGEWKNNQKDGHGVLSYLNGDTYVGAWENDKKTGHGVETYLGENNSKKGEYDGNWHDGQKNGSGTYHYADGSSYAGDWINNKKDGQGTFFHSNQDQESGSWKNNFKHGEIVYTFANGHNYTLNYNQGKLNGTGWDGTLEANTLQEGIYHDGQRIDTPRPEILADNSQVNQLLVDLIRIKRHQLPADKGAPLTDKAAELPADKGAPMSNETAEIELTLKDGAGNLTHTLKIGTGCITLDNLAQKLLEDKFPLKDMYCVIKQNNGIYVLEQYSAGIHSLPANQFRNPLTKEPLRTQIEKNLLVGADLVNFLQLFVQ